MVGKYRQDGGADRLGCLFLLCSVTLTIVSRPTLADVVELSQEEHPTVLRMLAAHSKATCEAISTWRGAFEFEEVEHYFGARGERFLDDLEEIGQGLSPRPTEFRKRTRGRVAFALDVGGDRLFSRFETDLVSLEDSQSGESLNAKMLPFGQTSIVTPDEFLHLEAGVHSARPDGLRARMAFREPRSKVDPEGDWGAIVDPRILLGYGKPTWENLEAIAAAIDQSGPLEAGGIPLIISREGEAGAEVYHVIEPGQFGPVRIMLKDMTFDYRAGLNMVALEVRRSTGEVHQQLRWGYAPRDGVMTPHAIEYRSFEADSGKPLFHRTMRLVEAEINPTLSVDVFSAANLELNEGDLLIDRIADRVSRVENGSLQVQTVTVDEFFAPAGQNDP